MPSSTTENSSLATVISDIRKKFGSASISFASEAEFLKVRRIRTEIPSLDFASGGGLPLGRIIHIFGRAHSGKTFLSMKMAGLFQKAFPDLYVFWGDLEQVFDPERAAAVGVDLDRIIVCQPSSAEEGFAVALELAANHHISLAVYDSIAAVSAMVETEAAVEAQSMGVAPRLINKFLRKWLAAIAPHELDSIAPTLILTNQKRAVIGGFRPMEGTPGGKGIGFFSSIELEISHGDKVALKDDDDSGEPVLIGHDVNFTFVKNNTFPLGKKGKFILCTRPYTLEGYTVKAHGTDWPIDLLRYAVYYGVVNRSGGSHTFGDIKLGNSKAAAQAALFNNAELAELIYGLTLYKVKETHGVKQEEVGTARKPNSKKGIRKSPARKR